jgi:hypothetical protein
VDVRIGVIQTSRELEVELADDADPDDVKKAVDSAVAAGAGMLWLLDRKGRQLGVQIEKLAYIDIGPVGEKGRIGFGG